MPHAAHRKLLISKPLIWLLGTVAAIVVIIFVASFFIDERLRRITENKINRDLKGYSVGCTSALSNFEKKK